ncbi:PfkB family carbohydrate kinase [Candidatus Margulisiibacteriota bacterium]
MTVTVVGTLALDTIRTPYGQHNLVLGGSATFSGVAASIYTKVNMVSIIGEDFPHSSLIFFKARNIDLAGIELAPGKTFFWEGYYEGDMSQAHTVATHLNVLTQFNPKVPKEYKNSKIVFLANVDPIIQKNVIKQMQNSELIVLDSMNYWIKNKLQELKDTLKLVDVLIINDQELRQLTGIHNIAVAVKEVLNLGPKRIIVKKGENGAVMYNGQDYFFCPAFPVEKVIDPTGAGDSFAGAFCGYLDAAKELTEEAYRKAVIVGTLVSSFTVQGFSLELLKTVDNKLLRHKYRQWRELVRVPESL